MLAMYGCCHGNRRTGPCHLWVMASLDSEVVGSDANISQATFLSQEDLCELEPPFLPQISASSNGHLVSLHRVVKPHPQATYKRLPQCKQVKPDTRALPQAPLDTRPPVVFLQERERPSEGK